MGIEFHDVGADHARTRAAEDADDQKRRDRVDTDRAKANAGRFQQALRAPGAPALPGAGTTPANEQPPAEAKAGKGAGDPKDPAAAGQPSLTPAAQGKAKTPLDERLARLAKLQSQRADGLVTLQAVPPPKATVAGEPADAHAAAAAKKGVTADDLHELPVVKERSRAGRDAQRQQDDAANTTTPSAAAAGAPPMAPRGEATAAAPPPRGAVPEGLLKQMVEYAAVHQRADGVFEFRMGLSQGVLGGARMRMQAHGNRRVSIEVLTGKEGGVTPEELATLVESLKARGVEVVEAVVR